MSSSHEEVVAVTVLPPGAASPHVHHQSPRPDCLSPADEQRQWERSKQLKSSLTKPEVSALVAALPFSRIQPQTLLVFAVKTQEKAKEGPVPKA